MLAFVCRIPYIIIAFFPFLAEFLMLLRKGYIIRGPILYVRDAYNYSKFMRIIKDKNPFQIRMDNLYPRFYDRYEEAGLIPRHYFLQDIWAAQKVHESKVDIHYDFGSRVNGFIAHCLCFTKVIMIDIRSLDKKIDGLSFVEGDIRDLTSIPSNSIASLSSLHAIEHVGLGRYGDPIDPDGYRKAFYEIQRVLAKGGQLYLSVPVGIECLQYNAHRIFDPLTVLACCSELQLLEFSVIDDNDRFVKHADPTCYRTNRFACGLFHFTKCES